MKAIILMMRRVTDEVNNMKIINIKWQRLVSAGKTCPRCGSTEAELKKAISTLKQSLAPLGIQVVLEKIELSVAEFKRDPLRSNQIWINDRLMEDWIGGKVGQSPCCDVCGPSGCRTLSIDKNMFETIPEKLIIRACLLAAAELFKD
jgi:hypothetical protein